MGWINLSLALRLLGAAVSYISLLPACKVEIAKGANTTVLAVGW